VLPDLTGLDEWDYPVLHSGGPVTDVTDHLIKDAKRAIAACPVNALCMRRRTSQSSLPKDDALVQEEAAVGHGVEGVHDGER